MVPELPVPDPAAAPHAPRLLVSVRDAAEAMLAAAGGADIVDAKDPLDGPLGALSVEAVLAIISAVAGRAATSAVAAGPDEALPGAVAAMAAANVDYVKVAATACLLADPHALENLAAAAPGRLVAVIFAEDISALPGDSVAVLAEAGFAGAMIDTRGKAGRRLTDILDPAALGGFVARCRARNLLSGLAGSLRVGDVAVLSAHQPAYLGFRGGLCLGGDRTAALDPRRLAEAVAALAALRRRDAA